MQVAETLLANQPTKKRGMFTYAEFSRIWRSDPVGFWRLLKKSCSCDPGDVRFESGIVVCGVCDRKLVARK